MGKECHSIRPTECSTASTITDAGCTFPYTLHRYLRIEFLFPLRNTPFLAFTDPLHDILHVVKSINFWNTEPPFGFSKVFASVVTLCFLLPCQTSPNSGASPYQEVHFWISSARHYINGCFCIILN
jgi:hypothetical protein